MARENLDIFVEELRRLHFDGFPQTGVETVTENEIPGLAPEPGSAAEILALRLARRNHTIAVPYATEAGHFQQAGVPTVVCGPGRIDQAHQPNEYIDIAEMAACVAFMRALAGELTS